MPALEPVVPLRFTVEELPEEALALRAEVREFLAQELAAGAFVPSCDAWLSGSDKAFSRRLGERGWLGMTWPNAYGGHERSALERYRLDVHDEPMKRRQDGSHPLGTLVFSPMLTFDARLQEWTSS